MSTTAEPEPSARVLQRKPWPFHHCPTCGHEEFEVSCRSGHVVFSCQGCSRDWRFVLGYLQELPAHPVQAADGRGIEARVTGTGIVDRRTTTMPVAGQG